MSDIFIQGPIDSKRVEKMISKVQSHRKSGALNLFLGQIRADEIDGQSSETIVKPTNKKLLSSKDLAPKCSFGIIPKSYRKKPFSKRIVKAIDYSCYQDMAISVFEKIKKEGLEKFNLNSVEIIHSLGSVPVGGISLAVFVTSAHRKASFEGLEWIVESIKKDVPIFGKEIFEEGDFQWKVNK